MEKLSTEQKRKMEKWIGKYLMTSWENYADFLEKLGVPLLLRKLATMGTPIVEVSIILAFMQKIQNKFVSF